MAALVHLVRHAEVDNPERLVYGTMSGYALSPQGTEQARRVGRYLGPRPLVSIWSSPMERCLRTAEEIAGRSGIPVKIDEDLGEWEMIDRWKGHPWDDIPSVFPGELEAYLKHPDQLAYAVETLQEVAERVARVARRLDLEHPHGDVVVVSHQDPIQAARLRLTGAELAHPHRDKPGHGAVITVRPGDTWREETTWSPGESSRFGEKGDLRLISESEYPSDPASA